MQPPTPHQRAGFDEEYNRKLMEEWEANNQGEPPPLGGLRYFPMRIKTQEKPNGKSNNHS